MRIRGEQLYLFSGNMAQNLRPIAFSTDCSLKMSVDAIEVCANSSMRRYRRGLYSWSVESAQLLSYTAFDEGCLSVGQPKTLAISVLQKELVEAGVKLDGIAPAKTLTLVGRCWVTDISITGAKSQIATKRFTFIGSGQLGVLIEQSGFPYVMPIVF